MKRETFVQILSALLAEADDELLREAEGLVFWRKRELRAQLVQQYRAGDVIEYTLANGQRKTGKIHHLNKYSVTVRWTHQTQGYQSEVIAIERVLGHAGPEFDPAVEDLGKTLEDTPHA